MTDDDEFIADEDLLIEAARYAIASGGAHSPSGFLQEARRVWYQAYFDVHSREAPTRDERLAAARQRKLAKSFSAGSDQDRLFRRNPTLTVIRNPKANALRVFNPTEENPNG